MARVLVVSDDGQIAVTVESGVDDESDEVTTVTCPVHGDIPGDRSYFEGMVQQAEIHVDGRH